MVAYQDDALTCQAVADALTGVTNIGGVLPVSPVDAAWEVGDGLQWQGFQRLGRPVQERLTFWAGPSLGVDSILNQAQSEGAIPGARVV